MVSKGVNYFGLREFYKNNLPKPSLDKPRVFISHQKKDSYAAKALADYIQNAGVDVYFDQYDTSINLENPQSVVEAIGSGIKNSTHMLVLFSQNTLESMWVPWEIGYAYNSGIRLNVIRLKEVNKDKLPEYLKIVNVVMSIYQLNSLIANIKRMDRKHLILEDRSYSEENATHVLNKIMDTYA
jgi:hypothetical protein